MKVRNIMQHTVFCVLLFAFNSFAIEIEESATFEYLSKNAHIVWPNGNFAQSYEAAAPVKLGQHYIEDTDSSRIEKIALSNLNLKSLVNFHLSTDKKVLAFYSKESDQNGAELELNLETKTIVIQSNIDTSISKGTRKPLGKKSILKISNTGVAVLSFKLPEDINASDIKTAYLRLPLTPKQYGNTQVIVHQFSLPKFQLEREFGLSQNYFYDEEITTDDDVYFADNFDENTWKRRLLIKTGIAQPSWPNKLSYSPQDTANFIDSKSSRSVLAPFSTKRKLATNLDFNFKKRLGFEPEEAYFRYYFKLEEGANVSGGGKLPGFGGTYNKAGWGGRGNNGFEGWSARGGFYGTITDEQSHWKDRLPIGQYLYEVSKSKYGQTIPYGHPLSTLKPGKWYSIEQHLKLNTPGEKDGILEAWIDGVKVFSRSDLQLRNTPKLKIEKIWFNFYFGGTEKPKHDFNVYVDNIVIASKYIGPMFTGR